MENIQKLILSILLILSKDYMAELLPKKKGGEER